MQDFFGIDIGHHKIRISQVTWKLDKPNLIACAEFPMPPGSFASDEKSSKLVLVEAIKSCMQEAGVTTTNIVGALSEISVTSRLEVGFPKLEGLELNEAIIYEARKYISYPIDQMQLDKIIVGEKIKDGVPLIDVFWVATTKSNISKYLALFEMANLNVLAIETESIANARLINQYRMAKETDYDNNESVVIVDIGSDTTTVAVVKNELVLFSQSLGNGSDAMTRVIELSFNIDSITAENYKKTYGLGSDFAGGKLAEVLTPLAQMLLESINKTISFFLTKLPEASPKKVYLTGDGAQLPGLPEYSSKFLGLPVFLVDALSTMPRTGSVINLSNASSSGFNISIGLALKK